MWGKNLKHKRGHTHTTEELKKNKLTEEQTYILTMMLRCLMWFFSLVDVCLYHICVLLAFVLSTIALIFFPVWFIFWHLFVSFSHVWKGWKKNYRPTYFTNKVCKSKEGTIANVCACNTNKNERSSSSERVNGNAACFFLLWCQTCMFFFHICAQFTVKKCTTQNAFPYAMRPIMQ